MYNVIMVPTDGSGFDREAIRVALRLAEKSGAKIRLVRVLTTGSFFGMAAAAEGTAIAAEMARSERDKALGELYALAAECRVTANADVTVDLHAGPVADVLQAYAKRHEVDLIVLSTHGRTGISRMTLGSVTDSLIRHTSVPVLVVKPPTSYLNPQARDEFRRVVVPLDGSTLAEQILPRVTQLAMLEEMEITLLHILTSQSYSQTGADPDATWWDKNTPAQEYLFRIAKKLRSSGALVRTDIVVGENVADAIGEFAGRESADLIAIATHGRGGLARVLRGSVADAVMHSGNASMLVFKPEQSVRSEESVAEFQLPVELIPA